MNVMMIDGSEDGLRGRDPTLMLSHVVSTNPFGNPMRMLALARVASVLVAVTMTAGCEDEAPAAEAAAHVENPVAETALTTVHLSADAVRRVGIEVASVERKVLARTRSLGGELVAPSGSSVVISAPRTAIVLPPPAGEIPSAGTVVARGAPILRLAVLAADELAGPQQAFVAAEARVLNARAKAERTRTLRADGVASEAQLEDAVAELTTAEAAWEAARARAALLGSGDVEADLSALQPVLVRAPRAGTILAMHVGAGQTVADGAPLVEVVDSDPLWVRVPLFAADADLLDRSREAWVEVVGGGTGERWSARPIDGPATANASAASVDIYYQVANPSGRFRPGQRVGVRVPLAGSAAEQTVVPWGAVVHDIYGGAWVYEDASGGVYIRRRVEVTDVVDGWAVIGRGIDVGLSVVAVGAAELFSTEFGGTSH